MTLAVIKCKSHGNMLVIVLGLAKRSKAPPVVYIILYQENHCLPLVCTLWPWYMAVFSRVPWIQCMKPHHICAAVHQRVQGVGTSHLTRLWPYRGLFDCTLEVRHSASFVFLNATLLM